MGKSALCHHYRSITADAKAVCPSTLLSYMQHIRYESAGRYIYYQLYKSEGSKDLGTVWNVITASLVSLKWKIDLGRWIA